MKKYLVILMTLLAMSAFSGSAFAVTIDPDNTASIGGADFTPSTGVTLKALASATAYAVQSKHLSGNKLFGTLATDSDITTATGTIGNVIGAPTSSIALNLVDAAVQ